MTMNIIVLGAPGAGKGTYCTRLKEKYGIPHISTGDLLRDALAAGSELGLKARGYMDRGELVPDDIVLSLLKERLGKPDAKKGFLLDGYPRNLAQAESLEKIVKIDYVLNFIASKKVILDRLGGRVTCRNCQAIYNVKYIRPKVDGVCDKCGGPLYQREDQKPEAIKVRLAVYEKQTKPLTEYYTKKKVLHGVDADRPIEEIEKIMADCDKALKPAKQ